MSHTSTNDANNEHLFFLIRISSFLQSEPRKPRISVGDDLGMEIQSLKCILEGSELTDDMREQFKRERDQQYKVHKNLQKIDAATHLYTLLLQSNQF